MKKVAVIGGGAAGMTAAIAAAGNNDVTLLEKNEKLGKKLFITGKGRCNLTNASDMKTVMENVITNPRFLYSAFNGFTNRDIMDLIEKEGCPLKTERGNRVFPVSDHSSDVIKALTKRLIRSGVHIELNTEVKHILTHRSADKTICLGAELADGKKINADAVIVATGGMSYPLTGSTGDGYRFAKECGHTVTKLYPSLVPFVTDGNDAANLQGLSLRNITATLSDGKKELYSEFGEMIFTHFGVSGPVLLSASSYAVEELKKGHMLTLGIDLKPALTKEQLDARILRDFSEEKNRKLKNALGGLLPVRLIDEIIKRSGIPQEQRVNVITKEQRMRLVETIKNLNFTVTGVRGFNEAIITKGGVKTSEIDPKTMQSKTVQNLYFAGEVLDVDALTGGYNLQIAWSTGWIAGSSL